MVEDRLRLIYEAELAYLRGDFARVMQCYHKTGEDDAARLRAAPLAIAAAISSGDYRAYTEIESYLIMLEIYEKLFISGRDKLAKYVF